LLVEGLDGWMVKIVNPQSLIVNQLNGWMVKWLDGWMVGWLNGQMKNN
jgi:hypothetical protein